MSFMQSPTVTLLVAQSNNAPRCTRRFEMSGRTRRYETEHATKPQFVK